MGGTYRSVSCRYSDAKPGPVGSPVTTEPLIGLAGKEGTSAIEVFEDQEQGYTELSAHMSLLYYEMALREIEFLYVNNQVEHALSALNWLASLLFKVGRVSTNRELGSDYGNTKEVINENEIDAIRSRVFMLIRRISLNLDFYGNSSSYVPLASYTFYSRVLDDFLTHAEKIESLYIRYRDASGDLDAELRATRDNIDSQTDFIADLEQGLIRINETEGQLVEDIAFLTNQYEDAWNGVVSAGEDFKQAVRESANGCSFKEVITTVATIAVAVKTMGAGWAMAAKAFETYDKFDKEKDWDDDLGDLSETAYKVKRVVKVGEGVSEIASGLGKIADLLDRDEDDPNIELPSDAGKLITTREELERTIDPFRHLPEAEQYLKAVDDFIDLVTTRNSKIIEYNELNSLRSDITYEIKKQEVEIGRLRGILNNANAASLPEFANFMGRSNLLNKKSIIQMLYSEHKAMEYTIARKVDFRINRDTVGHLSQIHYNNKKAIKDELEYRGRDAQRIKFEDGLALFSIREDLSEEKLEVFKSRGEIFFSLPELRYESLALVKFDQVVIEIEGIGLQSTRRGEDMLGFRLSHLGSAQIKTLSRNIVTFNHDTRVTFLSVNPVTGKTTRPFPLGGDGDNFIQLTPKGPWVLQVAPEDMDRTDLSEVTDIRLNFEGEFYSL